MLNYNIYKNYLDNNRILAYTSYRWQYNLINREVKRWEK